MRSHNCIAGDPLCGILGDLCRHCRAELSHQRELELIRARADEARTIRIIREERSDALAELIVDNPRTSISMGLGALAAGLFGAALERDRKLRRKYGLR